jgi:hypothetical protein
MMIPVGGRAEPARLAHDDGDRAEIVVQRHALRV